MNKPTKAQVKAALKIIYKAAGWKEDIESHTIERCAKVADAMAIIHSNPDLIKILQDAAACIRALKDES